MPWKDNYRADCRACGRLRGPDERFSARGKCPDCGIGRMTANALELHTHRGDFHEHWRRRVAASVGATFREER